WGVVVLDCGGVGVVGRVVGVGVGVCCGWFWGCVVLCSLGELVGVRGLFWWVWVVRCGWWCCVVGIGV
ncbi:hypothetical protein, partial [Pseudomonas syringae group genomosp. 7]|uniref:hypothetical protein n=1 Tax=Pseudomonas syringae group genomosp. 7 TaxID=251699 RepID=UPI00376FB7FD